MPRRSLTSGLALLACLVASSAAAQGATVTVTIASGPNAGSYSLKDPRACVMEPSRGTQSRTLKATVSDSAKVANPKMLGNVIFEIPLAASGVPSPLLDIDLIFGEPDNVAADYYVTTISEDSKTGRGTVTVNDKGATASLTFQAETAKGVKFQGRLDCAKVRS